jgi:hypothetical protein
MEENPYLPPHAPAASVPMPHSRRGIASFVLVLLSVAIEFAALVAIGIMGPGQAGTTNATVMVLLFAGGSVLDLIAIGIGIDALLRHRRQRRRLFALLGVVGGLALLALLVTIVVAGLMVVSGLVRRQ